MPDGATQERERDPTPCCGLCVYYMSLFSTCGSQDGPYKGLFTPACAVCTAYEAEPTKEEAWRRSFSGPETRQKQAKPAK